MVLWLALLLGGLGVCLIPGLPRLTVYGLGVLAGILYLAGSWAWHMHCFFFFHVWDESRTVADVCLRCGEIRFK